MDPRGGDKHHFRLRSPEKEKLRVRTHPSFGRLLSIGRYINISEDMSLYFLILLVTLAVRLEAIHKDDQVSTIKCDGITFVKEGPHCPYAQGDKAMVGLLDVIGITDLCASDEKGVIVDVGGLYGDFGLECAKRKCPTVIYEPQGEHAANIKKSVDANDGMRNLVTVKNEAITKDKEVFIVRPELDKVGRKKNPGLSRVHANAPMGGAGNGTLQMEKMNNEKFERVSRVPGVSLDVAFPDKNVILLKIDVEGKEGHVLATAAKLLQEKRIRHLVYEYTPNQFRGRGTDYLDLLKSMYSHGARHCYALHRDCNKIFVIPKEQVTSFYKECLSLKVQTDVYCHFAEEGEDAKVAEALDKYASQWEASKNGQKGIVLYEKVC